METTAKTKKGKILSSNFGKYGWFLIIMCMIMQGLSAGLNVSGLNLTISHYVEVKGWSQALLLNYSTIGGYAQIVASIFLGWWMHKAGSKKFIAITMLACGLATIWWGNAQSPVQYLIACALVNLLANGFATMGSSNLIASFYPKRKGMALGWTTMGINIADILYLPMLNLMIRVVGFNWSYVILGAFMIAMAIIVFFFVSDTPEERGLLPDNGMIIEGGEEEVVEQSNLSIGKLLKTPAVWLIGITFGVQYMCCTGVMGQEVAFLMTRGYEQAWAITFMSVVAVLGCIGSFAWGVVDGKIGTKKASIAIGIWYSIVLILLSIPGEDNIHIMIALAMLACAAGGTANLAASMTANCFGRKSYAKAFGVVCPIMMAIRSTGYSVLALGITYFGSYNMGYFFLLICMLIGVIACIINKDKRVAE